MRYILDTIKTIGIIEMWFDENKISLEDFRKLNLKEQRQYLHREDGPAYVSPSYMHWMQNGKLHRLDGPAKIDSSYTYSDLPKYEYHIFGVEFDKEEFEEAKRYLEENGMEAFILNYRNN